MKIIEEGKKVFYTEIDNLILMADSIDETFKEIVSCIVSCKGKVVITGMGKSGHIARKIAATMSSLGTPSFYLHPAEALHGDLGMVAKDDIIIAISFSGESDEIINLLPSLKVIGTKIISITSNPNSTLAKNSNVTQNIPKVIEADALKIAPTSSTTVVLAYGDALAVVASKIYGFTEKSFGLYHPAGTLGKKIIYKVNDLMHKNEDNSAVLDDTTLKNAIIEMSHKGLGIVSIVDKNNILKGIITDGDLRRQLEKETNIFETNISHMMTRNPIIIHKDKMAVDALQTMKNENVSCLPVIDDNNKLVGTICLKSIVDKGLVL